MDALIRASSPRRSIIVASESLAVTTSKAVIGLSSAPVVFCSLFALTQTGCGLTGELGATLEGVAYVIAPLVALSSVYSRCTTGRTLREAELDAVTVEMRVLEDAGASEEKKRLSSQKAEQLANGPADLLGLAESACIASVAAALIVFGMQLATRGSLPSALPSAGAACWS